jgi:hypothetical protein
MYISIDKSLELINQQEFNLLKTFEINDTVTWDDFLYCFNFIDLLKLKDNKVLITDLFKLADLVYTLKCFCGGFKIKARSGFIENGDELGFQFIPRGILTYKLKNSVEAFAKRYNCEYEVCDSYIYLGIKRDKVADTEEKGDICESRKVEIKAKKEPRRR